MAMAIRGRSSARSTPTSTADCPRRAFVAWSARRVASSASSPSPASERGLCPSCEGRRTAQTAAQLVDERLPETAAYRHWVLTFPIAVRLLLAREPALITAVLGLFVRRVLAHYRRAAREVGVRDGQPAAVTAIQLAGGALNVNPHFHCIFADGVFWQRAGDEQAQFVGVLSPTAQDVERVCGQVARRVSTTARAAPVAGAR